MKLSGRSASMTPLAVSPACLIGTHARADETIKIGFSVPPSGSGSNWGNGVNWVCNKAAQEIRHAGGVKIDGKVYNYDCIVHDNKYTAADRIKVAQTLLNRDGDEPLTGFNRTGVATTLSVFQCIRRDFGCSILLVEHNTKAVISVCNRIVVLHHGQQLATGTPAQIRTNDDVITAHLGKRRAE